MIRTVFRLRTLMEQKTSSVLSSKKEKKWQKFKPQKANKTFGFFDVLKVYGNDKKYRTFD